MANLTKEQSELLVEFYQDQFRLQAETKGQGGRKKPLKSIPSFEKKVEDLCSQMRSQRPGRTSVALLSEYRVRISHYYSYAVSRKRARALESITGKAIPMLVRLDCALMSSDQIYAVDEDLIDYLTVRRPLAICRQSILFLQAEYVSEKIRTQMTDMVPTRPELEFPEALKMNRHFILHIGPTNSGKTYQALERLKEAKRGIYLGPLRLLALEVYERMQEMQVPAEMLTGQEHMEDEDFRVTAATVEMADLDMHYDIAVIDEAQMLSDPDRGHSWTRAMLGLRADEIHVCLAPAAEQVVCHLIELCHDHYEIHRYERKTELLFEDHAFEFPQDVQQGDALIVFSKKSVLDVAGRLQETGISSSVIYGSLPPEIRRRQMHMFTSHETKVVVSTDAIGMGLNLPVRRIIFMQITKYDGHDQRRLTTSEIRQIAGRAGRYGLYDTGYISAGDEASLEYLRRTYYRDEAPLDKVTLGFPQVLLSIDEPMDEILRVWHDEKPVEPFEKESVTEALELYGRALRVRGRIPGFEDPKLLYRMISCPLDIKNRHVVDLWLEYCITWASDITLRKPKPDPREKSGLARYETYYKQLDLYYQMSSRLGKVIDEKWIARERARAEDKIMGYLLKDKESYIKRCHYCGRTLPIDSPFTVCDRCWQRYR